MRILIDIGHPAQLNFLKIVIPRIGKDHDIYITFLKRGKLPDIVKREMSEYRLIKNGTHNGSLFSILVYANLFRLFGFIRLILKYKIDLGVNGGIPLGFALKLLGREHIQFDDDIERKLTIFLELISSDKLVIFPDYNIKHSYRKWRNVRFVNALKEWAYLSPAYFTPNPSILLSMNLEINNYIFLREVSNKTVNYLGQETGLIYKYQKAISSKGFKVVLSLEDKASRVDYPKEWLILEEPVQDIHSIMYYSRFVISSGDSMAREGAMLGVVSVYCGMRDMVANRFLEKQGLFNWLQSEQDLNNVLEASGNCEQEKYRKRLLDTWIDVNDLIVSTINSINRR